MITQTLLPTKIIDTHQHLWDISAQHLPWLSGAPDVLRHNYGQSEYRQAIQGLNVQSVYMEVDVAAAERLLEVDRIMTLIRNKAGTTYAAVMSGPIGEPTFAEYLDKIRGNRELKGLRRVLHNAESLPGRCLDPAFVRDIQLLGKYNLSFDLCMRPRELSHAAKLVRECPETQFILDHCGNADPKAFFMEQAPEAPIHDAETWKREMDALAALPNIVCKISGIAARLPKDWPLERLRPAIEHCLKSFGPSRVIFGSDWPVCLLRCELREWIQCLAETTQSRPQAERDQLWFQNAEQLYSRLGSN